MSGDDIEGMSDVTQSNVTVNCDVEMDVESSHAEGKVAKAKQLFINGKTTVADILKARKDFRKSIEGQRKPELGDLHDLKTFATVRLLVQRRDRLKYMCTSTPAPAIS